jgi:SAM-dependent methyltransferase
VTTAAVLPWAGAAGCPLCGASSATTLLLARDRRFGLPGRFGVVRCERCGLRRTDPRPADPGAWYPPDRYYSYAPPSPPGRAARARLTALYGPPAGRRLAQVGRRLVARALERFCPGLPPGPPGVVLDVGCGSGAALLALRQAGWRCLGLERDAGAVAQARLAGLTDVRPGDLSASPPPDDSADAVRFWHVLEHVADPGAQLAAARRALRPGGTLVLGVPNAGGLAARLAGDRWYGLDVPRHLWHFDRASLAALVTASGFVIERLELCSTGASLAGTLGALAGRAERAAGSRVAWYALLPAEAALDRLGLGEAIVLEARRP